MEITIRLGTKWGSFAGGYNSVEIDPLECGGEASMWILSRKERLICVSDRQEAGGCIMELRGIYS